VADSKAAAENLVHDFTQWIEEHKTEITALQIFYAQPYRRRELSYKMIKDLAEAIKTNKPQLAPIHIWKAYEQLEKVSGQPKNELVALVSLVRKISGIDSTLTAWDKTGRHTQVQQGAGAMAAHDKRLYSRLLSCGQGRF
jgi:type I restriction enzyme R subunit